MKKSVLVIMVVVFTLLLSNFAMAGRGHSYDRGHHSHSHGGHRGHYPGVFLGGVIVGGVLSSSINGPYHRRPIYVSPYPAVTTGSNFLLKSNGDCYLITHSSNGNQILSSVPASNCK